MALKCFLIFYLNNSTTQKGEFFLTLNSLIHPYNILQLLFVLYIKHHQTTLIHLIVCKVDQISHSPSPHFLYIDNFYSGNDNIPIYI